MAALAAEIEHFLRELGELLPPHRVGELMRWLDRNGYWWRPERGHRETVGTVMQVRDHLDHLRQSVLDGLPVLVTAEEFRRGGAFRMEGAPYVTRFVGAHGTCLVPAVIVDASAP